MLHNSSACFTHGVLPYQHGAREVPQSQFIFYGIFYIRFLYLLSGNYRRVISTRSDVEH